MKEQTSESLDLPHSDTTASQTFFVEFLENQLASKCSIHDDYIYTATQCNTLQHTATHSNTLQHTASHCITLHHTASPCITVHHIASHCNGWMAEKKVRVRIAHYNSLHHTASHCTTLHHTAPHCTTLHHTSSHFITPQHTAAHCNTLQPVDGRRESQSENITSQHTATHCNTLQHTATHCNTLQHTTCNRRMAEGKVKVSIAKPFALDNAEQAHSFLESQTFVPVIEREALLRRTTF